jgi:hypothetical protein
MNTLRCAALLLASALWMPLSAHAHGGAKPQHGGVVRMAQDLTFEIVQQGDGAAIYVGDHGQPKDVAGMQGRLTVLSTGGKKQADLKPAGGNRLEAKGVALSPGAKAVAVITTAAGQAISVRFVWP